MPDRGIRPTGTLSGFLDFAVADAGSAGADFFRGATDQSADGLQIYIPATIRYVVGVADLMPELRTLAADITNSCHCSGNS